MKPPKKRADTEVQIIRESIPAETARDEIEHKAFRRVESPGSEKLRDTKQSLYQTDLVRIRNAEIGIVTAPQ